MVLENVNVQRHVVIVHVTNQQVVFLAVSIAGERIQLVRRLIEPDLAHVIANGAVVRVVIDGVHVKSLSNAARKRTHHYGNTN